MSKKYPIPLLLVTIVFMCSCTKVATRDPSNPISGFSNATDLGDESYSGIKAFVMGIMVGCKVLVRDAEGTRTAFCDCMQSVIINNMTTKLTRNQAKEVIEASAEANPSSNLPYQEIVFSNIREDCGKLR